MSRLAKKLNKTPIRSPSPDIANRNIITRTQSPINQAISKSRRHLGIKNPFIESEQKDEYIKQLVHNYRILQSQNQRLRDENEKSRKQIETLKDMDLRYKKQFGRSERSINYDPDILSQYDFRIGQMSRQFKRLQDVLINQKRKGEILQQQNSEFQREKLDLLREIRELREREERNGKAHVYEELKLKKQLKDMEHSLQQNLSQFINDYQIKIELALREEMNRLNKIERDHKNILVMLEHQKRYNSPDHNSKTLHQDSTLSPFDTKTISEERGRKSAEKIINFQVGAQCQNCKIYLLKIYQLEAQLKIKQFSMNNTSKTSPQRVLQGGDQELYLKRLYEIKMLLKHKELQSSITHIEKNLNDIYSIDQKFEYMIAEKNKIIDEQHQKEIKQNMEIGRLKKENGILKVQVKEQTDEIEKMKETINSELKKLKSSDYVESITKKRQVVGETDVLRKYIEQAISKIQNLQDQIGNSLKQ